MKILVYGSKGWIGNQFIEILKSKNANFYTGESRLDNNDTLIQEIDDIKPTHIITFTGRTHGDIDGKKYTTIDYLEQEGKLLENVRDNLYSPLLLAELCKQRKIHYSYLGTGCIFKYDENISSFNEDSLPNFFGSSYSVVKGFTDRLLHLYNDSVLNLRIRMPITGSRNPRNFITKISTYEKVCSVANSMTVLPELLPFVLDMMEKNITGTVNLTNPGLISHNEILEMYKEIVDPDFTWNNFSQEEQRKILAADRSNNLLDTTKLETLYPQVKDIKTSVRECLLTYSELVVTDNNLFNVINWLKAGYIVCLHISNNNKQYYYSQKHLKEIIYIDLINWASLLEEDEWVYYIKEQGFVSYESIDILPKKEHYITLL
jgi:3,5-epimerase/4-reductase